jgi:hypothetical protein
MLFNQHDPFKDSPIMNMREMHRDIERKQRTVFGLAAITAPIFILFNLGLIAGVIWVAYHFIRKFW